MADLRDVRGNPVQLTDEHGNPIHEVIDENGNPIYITGLTTFKPLTRLGDVEAEEPGQVASIGNLADTTDDDDRTTRAAGADDGSKEVQRSTSSSSSSSSEDDGEGGRRKKKGLKEKIKEKFTGAKHKDEHGHAGNTTGEHHEKKSMMEKIKEKLPGHHNH
ncbi:embryogenic cell protein 40-like [Mercurialis annua]|uniref:embryogenic cell protein 40-like n=1 Tax=Mercurialis annua TaxID=3986 RepID=UPI00215F22E5|nr:embryogenic cell protein 40-like [Mercurialis annua]